MKKVCLVIMDGFGICEHNTGIDATKEATFVANLSKKHSLLKLHASGKYVGIYDGMMGNSEVGHLTIGAGRIVDQACKIINNAYFSGLLFKKISDLNIGKRRIHLLGLLSDAGIHSHLNNLRFLLNCIPASCQVYIHGISDGIDVPPRTLELFIQKLPEISSITGRYYAMDRDKNFNLTNKTFEMLKSDKISNFNISHFYQKGIEDEFIPPTMLKNGSIKETDTVFIFNHRPDRIKQLYDLLKSYCEVYTLIEINEEDPNAILKRNVIKNTLPEWLSKHNLRQLHIAESNKSAHITYFLNGEHKIQYKNEDRIIVPSPKVSNYEKTPSMSMDEVVNECIESIRASKYDFIVINLSGPDLLGHSGNVESVKLSVKKLDELIKKIYYEIFIANYALILTADHGNCEVMLKNGKICKSHTTNKVPLYFINIDQKIKQKENQSLKDIAPSILKIIGLEIPKEMTGDLLLE